MAIDDISSQLCLPMEQSFAYGGGGGESVGGNTEERDAPPASQVPVENRPGDGAFCAPWSGSTTRPGTTYSFSLKNSEAISGDDPSRTVVRVKKRGGRGLSRGRAARCDRFEKPGQGGHVRGRAFRPRHPVRRDSVGRGRGEQKPGEAQYTPADPVPQGRLLRH